MNITMRFLPLIFAVVVQQGPVEPGWTELFNGKDFTGWKVSGNQDTFKIQDGALVANGTVAHAFYDGPFRNHSFRNFELKVDVMTRAKSNGGVYVLTEFQPTGFPSKGFEIQVNNSHTDRVRTGSLYHVSDVMDDSPAKDDEWFTEHIVVQGDTITIDVNGKQTAKWTQPADWNGGREGPGRRITGPGTIALQGHDPGSTVYYKNIRIKPLDDGQAPASTPAAPAPGGRGGQAAAPFFISPEVTGDKRITFRLYAPDATTVSLRGGDIPAAARSNVEFTKGTNGVWELTTGAVVPGAYRYVYVVNGVGVVDPRNTAISESNTTTWSVATVPGSDVMDTTKVPHGTVSTVYYDSTALGRTRRMHVYTPPGYELGRGTFPVFYLLHGAGGGGRGAGAAGGPPPRDEFLDDFTKDVMPYVEKHYRVIADRAHRAIAGLSMGGSQTLNIAVPALDKFAYVGVYSSGLLGGGRGAAPAPGTPAPPFAAAWEQQNLASLDNAAAKKGLKLFWFSTGVEDGLMPTTKNTVELLKKHGFSPVMKESPGGHTWLNWRSYLIEFAPQLF